MLAPASSQLQNFHSRTALVFGSPAVALLLLSLLTALRIEGTVDSDVAWQLWIAERMHDGADLYRDIVETNPPLWFWMARPVERLSSLLHLRIESVLIVTNAVAVALALAATHRLLHGFSRGTGALFLCIAALILYAMPWMHVGQREQIVLITTLPYAALIAARQERHAVPSLLAASIGIAAGLGFALKHYFLIVPVLLELWLFACTRRSWRPFRIETLAVAAVGIVYAAAIFAEEDYLREIVPLVRTAYDSFSAPNLAYLLGPLALVTLAMAALLASNLSVLKQSPLATAFAVAALGFAAGYFIQFKGWPYHAIPMLGCAGLALTTVLLSGEKKPAALRVIGPALLCLPLSVAAQEAWHGARLDPDLEQAVAGLPPGTPVAFISENSALAWSVVLQRKFAYPQRYMSYWMLGAVVRSQHRPSDAATLQATWLQIVRNTVHDLRCHPPRRIIVARPKAGSWNANVTDPLPYFAQNPEFSALLGHYRSTSRTTLEVYDLREPIAQQAECLARRLPVSS